MFNKRQKSSNEPVLKFVPNTSVRRIRLANPPDRAPTEEGGVDRKQQKSRTSKSK